MAGPRRRKRNARGVMPELASIGKAVLDRRLALGLTQQGLADLAGTSRSTVQALEYGTGSVALGLVVEIIEVLGLRIALLGPSET